MKASEIIERLQEIIKANGDVEILVSSEEVTSSCTEIVKEKSTYTTRKMRPGTRWPNIIMDEETHSCEWWEIR